MSASYSFLTFRVPQPIRKSNYYYNIILMKVKFHSFVWLLALLEISWCLNIITIADSITLDENYFVELQNFNVPDIFYSDKQNLLQIVSVDIVSANVILI
jgi:hypothetical protein